MIGNIHSENFLISAKYVSGHCITLHNSVTSLLPCITPLKSIPDGAYKSTNDFFFLVHSQKYYALLVENNRLLQS